jgi:hypothetical protein
LRVPKLFHMRMDPFERADIVSDQYNDWLVRNDFKLFQITTHAAAFLQTFVEYPPSQEQASFSIDQIARDVEARTREKAPAVGPCNREWGSGPTSECRQRICREQQIKFQTPGSVPRVEPPQRPRRPAMRPPASHFPARICCKFAVAAWLPQANVLSGPLACLCERGAVNRTGGHRIPKVLACSQPRPSQPAGPHSKA